MLLGDIGVGRTTLLLNLNENKFDFTPLVRTTGVCLSNYKETIDQKEINLFLLDQYYILDLKRSIPKFKNFLIIFDLTSLESFKRIDFWVDQILDHYDSIRGFLVGNKRDLTEHRAVLFGVGQAKARDLGIPYMEISAETGENVEKLFASLTFMKYCKLLSPESVNIIFEYLLNRSCPYCGAQGILQGRDEASNSTKPFCSTCRNMF
ncbi:MAG: Rab family GTPase [Candidatus Hodarchaeota archaeon]